MSRHRDMCERKRECEGVNQNESENEKNREICSFIRPPIQSDKDKSYSLK